MAIHTSARVDKVIDHGDRVVVNHTGADGTSATAQAARAFICIGFCPNIERIGLDAAGVRVTATGAIDIDAYMRTSAPHIYAVGDVTAKVQFAHVASAQGVVAAETIAGVETMPLNYRMMPRSDILPTTSRQLRLHRRTGTRRRSPRAGRNFSHAR
jgi:dihydrolipoyl dehydrogenase